MNGISEPFRLIFIYDKYDNTVSSSKLWAEFFSDH